MYAFRHFINLRAFLSSNKIKRFTSSLSSPNNITNRVSLEDESPKKKKMFSIGVATTIPFSQFKHLATDKESERFIKLVLLEIQTAKQLGKGVPDYIEESEFKEFFEHETPEKRERYLQYLFLKYYSAQRDKIKKEQRRIEREKLKQETRQEQSKHIVYGINNCCMFFFVRKQVMHNFFNFNISKSIIFDNPIVFDLGLSEHMVTRELRHTSDQMQMVYHSNFIHPWPYNIYFCNAGKDNSLMEPLNKSIGNLYEDNNLITVTEKSYLEHFPKEKLIYLSPNAENVMHKFDPNAIYIIGAYVDKVKIKPVTLAKSKKEGIKCLKLPLDYYLHWGSGGKKSLTINQVFDILLDLRHYKDFKFALRHVPERKLFEFQQEREERLIKKQFELE